ncbi:MAG: hypothetical protein NTX84_04525 [Nitrospirae bacterium]|nr:hypothetical protein [Nitrospirota bacterium]
MKPTNDNRSPKTASSSNSSPSPRSGKRKMGKAGAAPRSKKRKSRDKIQDTVLQGRRSCSSNNSDRRNGRNTDKKRKKPTKTASDDDDAPVDIQIERAESRRVKNATSTSFSSKASKLKHADKRAVSRKTRNSGVGVGESASGSNKNHIDNINTPTSRSTKHSGSTKASTAPKTKYKGSNIFAPVLKAPKIDRLSVTVMVVSENYSHIYFAAHDLERSKGEGEPRLVYKEPKQGARYKYAYVVQDDKGKSIGYITFRPTQTDRKMNYFRFDYNPSKLSPGQRGIFNRAIKILLGKNGVWLLGYARITMMDIAIDAYGIPRSAILTYSTILGRSGTYGKWFDKGKQTQLSLETTYHGQKKSSPRSITVYDKRQERRDKGAAEEIEQDCVRFEARLRPRVDRIGADGKKKTSGANLHELAQVANPFGNFNVSAYPPPIEGYWEFDIFLAACESIGVDAALAKVAQDSQRRLYRKLLADERVTWWNPEKVMEKVIRSLTRLDLFPAEAFDTSRSRLDFD